MTTSVDNRTESFPGAGSTGPFTFNFPVADTGGFQAILYDISNNPTILTITTHYTVVLTSGGVLGAAVTLLTALAVGETLVIQGLTPLSQGTPFVDQGAFFPEKHEVAFDKLTWIVQESARSLGRAIELSALDDDNDINSSLPPLSANTVVTVNSSANGFDLTAFASISASIDTSFSGQANNDFFVYNNGTALWENKSLAATKTLLGIGDDALGKEGSNVASATTTDLGAADSNFIKVTGTTTITSFGSTTDRNHIFGYFGDVLTLTHNATSLILPGGANITTAANDRFEAVRLASADGNWMVVNYERASGASLVETVSGFETGDMLPTFKTTAKTGWLIMNADTVGDAGSGATQASASNQSLFEFLWDNVIDTYAAVSTGRGASANADWAAGKTITMPDMRGRGIVGTGQGTGLTKTWANGENDGDETKTIAEANLPSHTHDGSSLSAASGGAHTHDVRYGSGSGGGSVVGSGVTEDSTQANAALSDGAHTHTISGTTGSTGSGTALDVQNPDRAANWMIKL